MKKGVLLVASFLILTNLNLANASNQILLKSGRFTPPEGITTFTKASIEAIPGKALIICRP